MPSHEGTPLENLTGVSQALVSKLKSSWISTAEQFVAATAASGGTQTMARNLGMSVDELQRIDGGRGRRSRSRVGSTPITNRHSGLWSWGTATRKRGLGQETRRETGGQERGLIGVCQKNRRYQYARGK